MTKIMPTRAMPEPPSRVNKHRISLFSIVTLALILRVGALLMVIPSNPFDAEHSHTETSAATFSSGSDEPWTILEATNLVKLHEYSKYAGAPYAFRPPVGAFLTALIFWLSDYSLLAVRIVHVLLGVSVVWAMYLVGKLIWNETAGLVAALLTAVYPNIVMYTPLVISENPCIFFFVWSLYLFLRVGKRGLTNALLRRVLLSLARP